MAGKAWMPLNNFKKVHEDGQSARLIHPDGHEITLAKSILSPHMRQQLASLPLHRKMARGGKAKKMADGGLDVEAVDPNSDEAQADSSQQAATAPPGPAGAALGNGGGGGAGQGGPPLGGGMGMPSGGPYSTSPGVAMNRGANMQLAGIQGAAAAQSRGDLAQAGAIQKGQDQLAADTQYIQQGTKQWMDEINGFVKDYAAGNIDPNHYMESKSAGGKMATAIGVILGGLGGGMQRTGNNLALQFVNNQINRDIESQVQNMDKKKTLIGANLQLFGNWKDAQQMTLMQHQAMVAYDIQKYAAQSDSEIVKQNAKQMSGQLWDNIAHNTMQYQIMGLMNARGGYGGGNGGNAQQTAQGPAGSQALSQAAPYLSPQDRERLVHMPAGGDLAADTKDQADLANEATGIGQSLNSAIQNFKSVEGIDAQNPTGKNGWVGPWTTEASQRGSAADRLNSVLDQVLNMDKLHPGKIDPNVVQAAKDLKIGGNPINVFGGREKMVDKLKTIQDFADQQRDAAYKAALGDRYAPRQMPQRNAPNPSGPNQ